MDFHSVRSIYQILLHISFSKLHVLSRAFCLQKAQWGQQFHCEDDWALASWYSELLYLEKKRCAGHATLTGLPSRISIHLFSSSASVTVVPNNEFTGSPIPTFVSNDLVSLYYSCSQSSVLLVTWKSSSLCTNGFFYCVGVLSKVWKYDSILFFWGIYGSNYQLSRDIFDSVATHLPGMVHFISTSDQIKWRSNNTKLIQGFVFHVVVFKDLLGKLHYTVQFLLRFFSKSLIL